MCGVLICLLSILTSARADPEAGSSDNSGSNAFTGNNWAVIVSTSRYWLNYRHTANALAVYATVKRLGFHDSRILLMLPDDMACNGRSSYPGQIFHDSSHSMNLYSPDIEVDYRGHEVTADSFLRVLTGRHHPAVPLGKRLQSDAGSNILVYLTGHGGDEFLKFQDREELLAQELADAVQQMWDAGRYRKMLLIADTCQASTLFQRISAPGVISLASSQKGESSWAFAHDPDIGLSLMDRFTMQMFDFFRAHVKPDSSATLGQLLSSFRWVQWGSDWAR
ncbi:MAG: hypothetical protein WDW36_005048 [Sanguina aurantia]